MQRRATTSRPLLLLLLPSWHLQLLCRLQGSILLLLLLL
jgi:hypothetical protein